MTHRLNVFLHRSHVQGGLTNKEVDGIKFAFKTEIVTGPQTIVIEADQVIVNEEIDDDFFN